MPVIPARILTFLFVLITWVPFRAETLLQAKGIYRGMFLPQSWNLPRIATLDILLYLAGALIVLFFPTVSQAEAKFQPRWSNALIAVILLVCSMFLFVKTSPFIYFNF